jgi:hypothetical protein
MQPRKVHEHNYTEYKSKAIGEHVYMVS